MAVSVDMAGDSSTLAPVPDQAPLEDRDNNNDEVASPRPTPETQHSHSIHPESDAQLAHECHSLSGLPGVEANGQLLALGPARAGEGQGV